MLTNFDKQKASRELNEDQSKVESHIESLRRWVKSMPHLNCPTDDEFILKFLRVAKFDHFQAQKRLDNFCTIRTSERGLPNFFKFPVYTDEMVQKVLRSMQHFPLDKNEDGELIIIYIPGNWNPDEVPLDIMLKITFMALDVILADPHTQIHGIRYITDFSNCPNKVIEVWSDPHLLKNMIRTWQDCFPLRMKSQTMYHEPKLLHTIFKVAHFFMHHKQRKRFHSIEHGDFSKVFQKHPDFKKLMPKQYGGLGKSLEEYNNDFIAKFNDFYANGNPFSNIHVDESKRPQNTIHHLVEYADYIGDVGHEGSYTKLTNVF